MNVLDTFKKFMADKDAWDMYVTGAAGTGKTTCMKDSVQYCTDLNIPYVVCAYTHKACDILRAKLPEGANVTTLHSFLKKRPTINQNATDKKRLQMSAQSGSPDKPVVMFIDEYSMVGERDGMDIVALQDEEYEGAPVMKVCWYGDKNQLDPVGDMPYVDPNGDYVVTLTKIWRQAGDNPIMDTLTALVGMIEGTHDMVPLEAHKTFVRGINIVEHIKSLVVEANNADVLDHLDYVLLAYTNKRVEELNADIQGYDQPLLDDAVFSPTTKQHYKFLRWADPAGLTYIDTPFNGDVHLGSKYQTLEYLIKSKHCRFAELEDGDGNVLVSAVVFGHYQFKLKNDELKAAAAKSNKDIEVANPRYKAAAWAKHNSKTKLARARAKAWRDFLSFDECVMCIDFPHAMTVHKSQGSTYDTVYIDTEDLYQCARTNVQQYLKLMYVGISRTSNMVYTN